MLVKLQSTEMTAQRLPFNRHTLTSLVSEPQICCFLLIENLFVFVIDRYREKSRSPIVVDCMIKVPLYLCFLKSDY